MKYVVGDIGSSPGSMFGSGTIFTMEIDRSVEQYSTPPVLNDVPARIKSDRLAAAADEEASEQPNALDVTPLSVGSVAVGPISTGNHVAGLGTGICGNLAL